MLEVSVVIPAYNEEKRLPSTLDSVVNYLRAEKAEFEIIVVDDGSKDATAKLVEEYSQECPQVKLISYANNRGKGYAVRKGALAANGALVLINDADGSSPIEEIEVLKAAITGGADLSIGSRAKAARAKIVKALPYRTIMGDTFNRFVRSLLLPGFKDTQCGFKLFKNSVAKELFSKARINGFAFDVEVLYIALRHNYRIEEVAINWHNVDGSKINFVFDPLKMLRDIIVIKFNDTLGYYGNQSEVSVNS